jgi:hypothetical protein
LGPVMWRIPAGRVTFIIESVCAAWGAQARRVSVLSECEVRHRRREKRPGLRGAIACRLFQLGLLASVLGNVLGGTRPLFSLFHKGFTASIEVTS